MQTDDELGVLAGQGKCMKEPERRDAGTETQVGRASMYKRRPMRQGDVGVIDRYEGWIG